MNRYDHHFRSLPRHLRVIPMQKVAFARGALFEHRSEGFGPADDEIVVRQFDLSGMAEFWEIELSEPMACVDFTRSLASHFYLIEDMPDLTAAERKKLGPAAERVVDSVKAGIRQALRAARSFDEPWFTVIPEPQLGNKLGPKAWMGFVPSDVVIVPPDPPVDGIDLSKLRVQPRPAVNWMLASAKRRHLVPPSLVALMSTMSDECPPPEACAARGGSTYRHRPRRAGRTIRRARRRLGAEPGSVIRVGRCADCGG